MESSRVEKKSQADALRIEDATTPGGGNVNPFSQDREGATGGTGGVNPSGPTAGTEGWGLGKKEAAATGNERDSEAAAGRTFRCADMGNTDCRWEMSAQTEDDLMSQIERHGREEHGIKSLDEDRRRRILDVMRKGRAA